MRLPNMAKVIAINMVERPEIPVAQKLRLKAETYDKAGLLGEIYWLLRYVTMILDHTVKPKSERTVELTYDINWRELGDEIERLYKDPSLIEEAIEEALKLLT